MAGRYSDYKVLDYCFSPISVFRNGEKFLVPCGKCDGCLLHRVQQWSQRVSQEIDSNPWSIFFTLTYSNKYLPILVKIKVPNLGFAYISDHPDNVRFDGTRDVPRNDGIILHYSDFKKIPTNMRRDVIAYSSKRDFQLYLKLIREDIKNRLNPFYDKSSFRYYAVSEYGPDTLRSHIHGIIFPKSPEIAEFLLQSSLYQNWQMCLSSLFYEHCSYCDSGTAGYVSDYLASHSRLCAIYQDPQIKPFRLSSKSPGIGFMSFDKKEVFDKICSGSIEYTRSVDRPDVSFVLRYPSSYLRGLFPKCYQYNLVSDQRVRTVYGCIYTEVKVGRRPYLLVSKRLRDLLHSSDYNAALAYWKYYNEFGGSLDHYLFMLDMVYYKGDMYALRMYYEWQMKNILVHPVEVLVSYVNVLDLVRSRDSLSGSMYNAAVLFFKAFGVYFEDLSLFDLEKWISDNPVKLSYMADVQDIVSRLEKTKKFNEKASRSPHIV